MTFVDDALEALEGKRDGRILWEPSRRRPVLPGPAPPRRSAMRRPAPTRARYVRVLDSLCIILFNCEVIILRFTFCFLKDRVVWLIEFISVWNAMG